MDLLAAQISEFAQEFLLLFGEICRDFDEHLDYLVTPAEAPQVGHTLALEAEGLAVLRALRDLQFIGTFQRFHFHGVAERCLNHRYGNLTVDIISVALEKVMGFNVDENVKIALRASVPALLALASQPQSCAFFHPRRYLDLDILFHPHASGAAAIPAGFPDKSPLAPALGARRADAEETARLGNLPGPAAPGAQLRGCPRFGA